MFSRDQKLKSLERFVYKELGVGNNSAVIMCDIVGVLIGIKSAMQGYWPLEYADMRTMILLKKKLGALKLCLVVGFDMEGNRNFYVAKSEKRANELREAFRELFDKGPSAEIHTKLGKLLGYPDTAIQYFIRLHPENGISSNHQSAMERNRFYAHSMAHEDEEFAAYEEPIYCYIEKHCPRTAKFLKENGAKRWLDQV